MLSGGGLDGSGFGHAARSAQPAPSVSCANFAEYFELLGSALCEAELAERRVQLTLSTDEIWIDARLCWPAALVLAEMVRNAAREGLGGGPGEVTVVIGGRDGWLSGLVRYSSTPHAVGRPIGQGLLFAQTIVEEFGGRITTRLTPTAGLAWLRLPADVLERVCPAPGAAGGWADRTSASNHSWTRRGSSSPTGSETEWPDLAAWRAHGHAPSGANNMEQEAR